MLDPFVDVPAMVLPHGRELRINAVHGNTVAFGQLERVQLELPQTNARNKVTAGLRHSTSIPAAATLALCWNSAAS